MKIRTVDGNENRELKTLIINGMFIAKSRKQRVREEMQRGSCEGPPPQVFKLTDRRSFYILL